MGEVLTELEQLGGVEEEWRALAERRANAFMTPDWLRCWWRHYGDDQALLVPLVRDPGGGVAGLLPLAIARSGRPRVCRIAGANVGDLFSPLAAPEREPEVAAAVAEALASPPAPWSLLYLDNVEGEEWVRVLAESGPGRLRARERGRSTHSSIDLAAHDDWEAYVASRSSKLRTQIRRNQRRLDEHGVKARRTVEEGEVAADIETFFRLHDMRWEGKGGSTLSDRARAFHADFAAAALRRGWLRLWFLEAGDRAIAAWYGWMIGGVYAYYNGGFDPEWKRYGPGAAMLAQAIRASFEEGAERFDFLLGDEPYKHRFAEPYREVRSVVLARSGSPASLQAAADIGLRRLGGHLPDRIGRDSPLARRLAGLLPGSRRS